MYSDVLIIGGGLAGLMAADSCTSHNPNLSITILAPGAGNSPYVHGLNMPLHPEDSVEIFKQDVLNSGYGQSNADLVNTLCENSLTLLPLFEELGIHFNMNPDGSCQLLRPLGASLPRVASVGNDAGGAIMAKLRTRLKSNSKVSFITNSRAMKLLKNCDNKVIGALCYNTDRNVWYPIHAGAVILAAGGYSNIFPITTNTKELTGDPIALAYSAGAELTDLEFVQFEPSVAIWPEQLVGKSVITTMFYEGAVLKNAHGERFMLKYGNNAEQVDKDVMSKCIAKEILDGNGTEHGGVYFDVTQVGLEKLQTVYHAYYQRYKKVNIDISVTPMEIVPAPHTSLGGLFAKTDCSTNIKGLFVCGESLGGLHGANRIGGNAGLETLVFGRIAGVSAASFASDIQKPEHPFDCSEHKDMPSTVDISHVREQILFHTSTAVGVIRDGKTMKNSLQQLSSLCTELKEASYSYEAMRLYNDAITAYLVISTAYERKGSVGCHFRTDSIDEPEKYRIVITTEDGYTPIIQRRQV